MPWTMLLMAVEFQSTPSARRATVALRCLVAALGISIHALREESDDAERWAEFIIFLFQSTPSARRATHAAA